MKSDPVLLDRHFPEAWDAHLHPLCAAGARAQGAASDVRPAPSGLTKSGGPETRDLGQFRVKMDRIWVRFGSVEASGRHPNTRTGDGFISLSKLTCSEPVGRSKEAVGGKLPAVPGGSSRFPRSSAGVLPAEVVLRGSLWRCLAHARAGSVARSESCSWRGKCGSGWSGCCEV